MRWALLTMIRDEGRFLPTWFAYYRRTFQSKDIYILDNETSDGSTRDLDSHVLPVTCGQAFHHPWMLATSTAMQAQLFRHGYECVVYADADELLVPHPSLAPDLAGLLEKGANGHAALGAEGYHIVQEADEAPLDWESPLLAQRRSWVRDALFDKPTITYAPVEWELGFHRLTKGTTLAQPGLFLLHLHRIDYEYTLIRHRQRVSYPNWHEESKRHGWGVQNQLATDAAVDRWYRSGVRSMMPEWVQAVI
jgi:hypothetical protein